VENETLALMPFSLQKLLNPRRYLTQYIPVFDDDDTETLREESFFQHISLVVKI